MRGGSEVDYSNGMSYGTLTGVGRKLGTPHNHIKYLVMPDNIIF